MYLSAITVTNISRSFYLQDGGKNQLAQIWNKTTSLSPYALAQICPHRQCNMLPDKIPHSPQGGLVECVAGSVGVVGLVGTGAAVVAVVVGVVAVVAVVVVPTNHRGTTRKQTYNHRYGDSRKMADECDDPLRRDRLGRFRLIITRALRYLSTSNTQLFQFSLCFSNSCFMHFLVFL